MGREGNDFCVVDDCTKSSLGARETSDGCVGCVEDGAATAERLRVVSEIKSWIREANSNAIPGSGT